MQAKNLSLTAQVEARTKGNGGGARTEGSEEVSRRYLNPKNKADSTRGDRKYKWCTKNCHKKPVWCGRPNCLSREDFTAKKKAERKEKSPEGSGLSNDFKIALAAVTSDEGYKALEAQLLGKK